MSTFTLRLQDATHTEDFGDVASFVGADESGSFGILAGHARMMTALTLGLSRFRIGEQSWKYVATSSGLVYMNGDLLTLSARFYVVDEDYMRISRALADQLLVEEEKLAAIKESLHRMEQQVLERLWAMSRAS